MDTQAVLGAFGAPFQIEWEGKKYTLSFRTQKLKAEVERWAKQRAVKNLVTLKSVLPADEYKERMDKLLAQFEDPDDPLDVDGAGVHQGGYSFGGKRVQKLLTTDEGALALFRVVLGEAAEKLDDSELASLFAEKRDEVEAFFKASQNRMTSLRAELGDDPDPKAMTRALKKADMW